MHQSPLRLAVTGALLLLLLVFRVQAAQGNAALDSYAEGRKLMQAGQFHKALESLNKARGPLQSLPDYLLFDEAACLEKTGDVEGALGKYREIIRSHKSSPLYRPAFRRVLELGRKWHPEIALVEYNLYLKEFPSDSRVLFDLAKLLEEAGRPSQALALHREVFISGTAPSLLSLKILRSSNRTPTAAELKLAAGRLIEKELYDEAISLFETLPPPDEEAKVLQARANFNRRRYREAIIILERSPLREGRMLLASSLDRANERSRFYGLMEELLKEGNSEIFSLHLRMAETKRREGSLEEAKKILSAMVERYPEKRPEIAWSQAWLEIRRRNFEEAEKILQQLVGQKNGQTDRNYFWLGKVRSYQGKDGAWAFSQLTDVNGYHFLKINESYRFRNHPEETAKSETLPPPPESLRMVYQRISDLLYLKMTREAAEEAQRAFPLVPPEQLDAFAQLLLAAEDYHSIVRLGIRTNILKYRYPVAFFPVVQSHARRNGLDPFLVVSLMREESHFRPAAVSKAGAVGVMQLMPATARRFGKVEKSDELFDVEKNISLGSQYLARLLGEFPSFYQALAAYNAGEARVRKWLESSYLDEDEFTQDIPFTETREYVLKVMRTYQNKKRLYAQRAEGL
ncbi:MAG: transglycosylase SLT domain-containing protein [Smithellaceae bacterium]|nr:transglycosylase SLT domain-containing protein [Smithellaceae bacterium]